MIKRKLINQFPGLWVYWSLITDQNSYLQKTGWKQSLKKGHPADFNGNAVPWMNYSVIAFLNRRLKKDFNLFEYGSGFSTFFYAERVKKVTTIEYDKNWYDLIKQKMPENVTIHFVEKDIDGDYCRSINLTNEKYDIVIVDGRDRVNCLKQAIEKLTDSGVIIFDDSNREKYREAFDYAKKRGFSVLEFEGLQAKSFANAATSVIYRRDNCLEL